MLAPAEAPGCGAIAVDAADVPWIRLDIPMEDGLQEIVIPPIVYLALAHAAILLNRKDGDHYLTMVEGLMLFAPGLLGGLDLGDVAELASAVLNDFKANVEEYKWTTLTDAMLHLSYLMLSARLITREQAFTIAQTLIPEQPPKSANSWRVRVDAYVAKHRLDPIGQPMRKRRAR